MGLTQKEVKAIKRIIVGQTHVIQNAHRLGSDIVLERIRRYVSIPIAIGILAIYFYYSQFGPRELIKQVLEWIIAGTIFATILAALGRQRKN